MSVTGDLDQIRAHLAGLGRSHTPNDVAEAMHSLGLLVTDVALFETVETLRRESVGAGRLDPLLHLDGVTDVLVNGPGQVYLDRGQGLEETGVRFDSEEEVRRLAQRLAAVVGRRLDEASPFVDARLPDGTRVHAVLATLAAPGTCLSLRVPSRRSLSLADCVAAGSLSAGAAQLLEQVITSRLAFLISGGTGSGKTTMLAALLSLVPDHERLVVVEDSRELAPVHAHLIRMECRPPNAERAGSVTLTDLVRQSLRMRPDRLVVGEVRGAEICDLLTALNTGHEGGCGTVHANSAEDVPARLEALAALGQMDRDALHAQLASALDAVIHLRRDAHGIRRVSELAVFVRNEATGLVQTRTALSFSPDGRTRLGPGSEQLERLLHR